MEPPAGRLGRRAGGGKLDGGRVGFLANVGFEVVAVVGVVVVVGSADTLADFVPVEMEGRAVGGRRGEEGFDRLDGGLPALWDTNEPVLGGGGTGMLGRRKAGAIGTRFNVAEVRG